jgi:DNA-binding PadR family transcriptional regulator
MNHPDEQDQDDGPVQRTVNAEDASRLHTPAASTVFNWRGAGQAPAPAPAPTAEPEQQHEEEKEPVATTPKKRAKRARNSSDGSPQLLICSGLLQNDLTREQVAEAFSELSTSQISSALNNAKSHGRIAWIEKDGVYRLTKTGKEWVQAAAGEESPPEPTRRKAAHRRGRAKRDEVDTSPAVDEAESVFRCAVMSDGCFFVSKEGVTIELEPDEHKQMLHYLERMAIDA